MTDERPDDWNDDRLMAAFAARASRTPPTPSDLAIEVGARAARRQGSLLGWAPVPTMALVLLLAAVVAGPYVGRPNASSSANVPGASGQPHSSPGVDLVREALGQPMTVSQALEVRDSEIDEREIQMKGYLSPTSNTHCSMAVLHRHPLMPPDCAMLSYWLMELPEELERSAGAVSIRQPSGPALIPSFALVSLPDGPFQAGNEAPVPIVVLGHFNDRRASTCGDKQEQCLETFLVDRVVELNGVTEPVGTNRAGTQTPKDPESDVDGLVAAAAPSVVVVSRKLVTAGQALDLEPVLKQDQIVPYIDQSKLAWLVTTVDLSDVDVPYARTFMLLDGSSWFAEITRAGAVMHERAAPEPTRGTSLGPTAEPNAFATAPFSVAGIRVEGVSDITSDLRAQDSTIRREVHAVRGWYIAPRPGVACDLPLPAVHAPSPPCDEARHWFLTDPQLYGVEQGQLRRDPVAVSNILNPLLPVDVPFDVGETWRGDVPVPQPVVVLGHFNDTRVVGYRNDEYFVIDALAWSRTDRPLDRVTRMTENATEDPSAVIARIAAVSDEEPLATWVTVMDAADFAVVESDNAARDAAELTKGAPVWIVQRLILREDELKPQFAIETGYTMDTTSRVWWRPTLDWYLDLATSIDLHDLDANTSLVRIFDYDQRIQSAGPATGLGSLDWQPVDGNPQYLEIARGRTSSEVVLRWTGLACVSAWDAKVHVYDASASVEIYATTEDCGVETVKRRLVIDFYRPVDIDKFNSGFCCG